MEEQSFITIVQDVLSNIDQKVESYVQHWVDHFDDLNRMNEPQKQKEVKNFKAVQMTATKHS